MTYKDLNETEKRLPPQFVAKKIEKLKILRYCSGGRSSIIRGFSVFVGGRRRGFLGN